MQFVVLDVETTGVLPGHDRVVEIALVTLGEDRSIADEFVTLVNPERDVGPTSIHGIQASHVTEAPTFAEVAGDIAARLEGRVIIGHNARFDDRFIREEFSRIGVRVGDSPLLCTLRMAYALEPDVAGRKLPDCCARAGVPIDAWHGALHDARATARLYESYMSRAEREGCREILDELERAAAQFPFPTWCGVPSASGRFLRRADAAKQANARRNYLGRLIHAMVGDEAPTATEASYLDLLDRALADRLIEPAEAEQLSVEAERWELTPSQVTACHHLYLRTLVSRAREDGIVTASERQDVDLVAGLLGVSSEVLNGMLNEGPGNASDAVLLAGRVVCFTGDFSTMSREEAIRRAQDKGVVAVDSVTKKTNLLVAADPESLSGKAQKARKYGIPIISEADFWAQLG
jgi:DNA polymerase-3 subunit epsilon